MGAEEESLTARAEQRIGRMVCGKWQLERLLGIGGVAAVYAARHRNGRPVAVKVLHPELALDPSIRRRFLREGYVANRVDHPGALVVLDDGTDDDGTVVLVMELLDGETLEARRRRLGGRLPLVEALRVTDEVLAILERAHAAEILHRDVTPSNVFVTRDGSIKLLDFGIARLRDGAGDVERTMSLPGALGTPAYMPPEQARGLWDELDARSDLWAVAAVLYRMLTGRIVHSGRTPNELLLAAMTKRAPPIAAIATDLPERVAVIVDRALAVDRDDRWRDARSFRVALADAYRLTFGSELSDAPTLAAPGIVQASAATQSNPGTNPDGFGTTIAEIRSPWRPKRALAYALLGVALLVAVGIGMAFSVRADGDPTPQAAAAQPESKQPPRVAAPPASDAKQSSPASTTSAPPSQRPREKPRTVLSRPVVKPQATTTAPTASTRPPPAVPVPPLDPLAEQH